MTSCTCFVGGNKHDSKFHRVHYVLNFESLALEMAAQNPTDSQSKKTVKHLHNTDEEKRSTSVAKAAKPILEDQALLREKLKSAPTWKRDQDSQRKRQSQPMVARPPSPGASTSNQSAHPQPLTLPCKPPSPPVRRRTPGNSPVNSLSYSFSRSFSPLMEASAESKRKLEKAMRARLYLLTQIGPNSFLIGGDSPHHKFKVMIGQQTCSCGRPFCVHLLFVMSRVFKVKENDPLLWSQKLKNYEVEGLFRKFRERVNLRLKKSATPQKSTHTRTSQRTTPPSSPTATSTSFVLPMGSSNTKDEEEVCPICLLEMVEGESLTSCRDGCHNRLHQHCMEIWFVECRRQKEPLNCPLCRKRWTSDSGGDGPQRSPSRTVSPNVPCPLGPEEITLPRSNPIPAGQVDLAGPWVEAFGENLVCCLFSREWNIRETALRRLSKDVATALTERREQSMAVFEACCSLLSMMCGDPVYRVYYAAVRTIRMMMAHVSYSCPNEKSQIQRYLEPVVEAILAKCADSNRRFSALSMKVLLEICKDQEGDFALGKMLENHESQELGGLDYILCCILKLGPEYAARPWWLGRLFFLRRLTDEYVDKLQLTSDCLQSEVQTVGVLIQKDLSSTSEDPGDIYKDNLIRLMSVVKFAMQAASCSHSKVAKLSVAVLICCLNLAAGSPTASVHVKSLVMKLKPAQRSILQRRLSRVAGRSAAVVGSDTVSRRAEFEREPSSSGVSSDGTMDDISEGAMSLNLEDETDNMTADDILSFVQSFTPPSSVDLDFDWSTCKSPRYPPVKLGKKCKDLVEQEEAEAIAKAIEVSVHERGPPRIPSLQPSMEEEMVIVYSQPESLDKAVDTKHLYLEGVHWKKGELLGTGAFSSCYAVRDVTSGSLMAVKQVSFCRNSSAEQEKVTQTIMDEITMMAKLQHPRLIKCLGATQHTAHFNIFLEWMPGGSISALLSKYGAFEDVTVTRYAQQILQGVAHLHQHGVIHRDIKGANILVDSTGRNIRIADFGAAARLASQFTGAGEFQGQLLGTIAFMAPEVLRGESYGRSCDLWSIGCVLIEMATGKPPWDAHEHSNHLALIFKIAGANGPPEVPEQLTPAIRDVMLRCLEPKCADRPTAPDLLKHPLFTLVFPGAT